MILLFIGLLSASFSSFFIAMHSRKWKNINKRSSCDICGENISPFYLIPIVGSLFSNFKCNKCKSKYSKNMFYSEISAFLISLFLSLSVSINEFNFSLSDIVVISLISSFLSVIIFEDLEGMYVSDIYSLITSALTLFYFSNFEYFFYAIGISFFIKILLDNIYSLYKKQDVETFGMGDILLFGIIFSMYNSLNISDIPNIFIIIGLIGILYRYIIFKGSDLIPFGPAIILGGAVGLVVI